MWGSEQCCEQELTIDKGGPTNDVGGLTVYVGGLTDDMGKD